MLQYGQSVKDNYTRIPIHTIKNSFDPLHYRYTQAHGLLDMVFGWLNCSL